jgi:hypothetical protein
MSATMADAFDVVTWSAGKRSTRHPCRTASLNFSLSSR